MSQIDFMFQMVMLGCYVVIAASLFRMAFGRKQ